jgi:tRNA G10  N-methylase Trm11
MKYLFILGRNIELSIAEIKSVFERDEINFEIVSRVINSILIETDKKIPEGLVKMLGGTISIGEVLASGQNILKELDKQPLYSVEGNKLNYVLFNFDGNNFDDIKLYLKRRFKEERLKATEKKLTGNIKLQSGEFVPKVSSNLINEQFFVFKNNFGRIIETTNPDEIEKRDMEKPIRRAELSISPRLAKILINLSRVKDKEILLDPFCGIGVILQEALLQNIKVIGIDKDKNAIHNARLNLKWFNFNEDNYKLINGDSSIIRIQETNGVATEPELGELQKKVPSPEKAKEIVNEFENLMIKVLKNIKQYVNGRIVFTAPLIILKKKRFSCDFEKIAKETELQITESPIEEFREDSFIGRSILVLQK